jgi:hypothetical protein
MKLVLSYALARKKQADDAHDVGTLINVDYVRALSMFKDASEIQVPQNIMPHCLRNGILTEG